MSTPSRTTRTTDSRIGALLAMAVTRPASSVAGLTVAGVRALAFWSAVVLPLAYVPLLVGGVGGTEATRLAVLLLANAVALVVGHGHDPGRDSSSSGSS